MVDPDGEVNVQKKRLKLGLIQEVNPTCNAEFPADGFQVGISCVPRIGYNHIWKYLIEDVEFKKQLSVEKPIVKGYNFFKSGKVLGLYSKSEKSSSAILFERWISLCCENHYTCQLRNSESILPLPSWK